VAIDGGNAASQPGAGGQRCGRAAELEPEPVQVTARAAHDRQLATPLDARAALFGGRLQRPAEVRLWDVPPLPRETKHAVNVPSMSRLARLNTRNAGVATIVCDPRG
jgi:hypothetical protein